ncbi:MAG: DUF881 domain-containing protein [Frankiales bacterium]|nr:DUF881 domain-containing protein [Frankiales bacterium]
MSLLVDIAASALDPSYAAAAARRAAAPQPSRRAGGAVLGLGVLAATLVIVVAGLHAHRTAPAAERARVALLRQVQHESADVDALQQQLNRLRAADTQLSSRVLGASSSGSAAAHRLTGAEVRAGFLAVSGPGLQVVLGDATDAAASGNRILDRDVQSVVNALWAAGAEAVAVDDERVTSETAVRQAGDAILVNLRPVAAPYVVRAIGDPVAMETAFATSRAAGRLRSFVQLYGLRFHYQRVPRLTLPAGPGLFLHYANPVVSANPGGAGGGRR